MDVTQTAKKLCIVVGTREYYRTEYEAEGDEEVVQEAAAQGVLEEYYEKTESGYDYYVKDNDVEWTKYHRATGMATVSEFVSYGQLYELFEYSAEHGGYLLNSSGRNIVFKFKNGKLVVIYTEEQRTNSDGDQVVMTGTTTLTYGGQSLTLPEVD